MADDKRPDLRRALSALFWLCAGLLVAGYLVAEGLTTVQTMRGGGRARGTVLETYDDERELYDGRRVEHFEVAVYEFAVGGRRFMGKVEGAVGYWEQGDQLDVEYNPADPTKNRAAGDRRPLADYLLLLLLGGLFSYYSVKLNYPVVRDRLKFSRVRGT